PPPHTSPPSLHDALPISHRRTGAPERRGRSGSGGAPVSIRPLRDDRVLPSGNPGGELARDLERADPSSLEQQLHAEHQHADELLARRGVPPSRMPPTSVR